MPRPDIEALMRADREHHVHPMTALADTEQLGPVLFVRGEGVYLYGADDNAYLDAYSGLGNVILGHGHRRVLDAIKAQLDALCYVPSFARNTNPAAAELAGLLAEVAPGSLNRVHFANSGSEANEVAIKIARAYHDLTGKPNKRKIISRDLAYHGVTFAALSAGGIPSYKQHFGPFLEGFVHISAPYHYRCRYCGRQDACTLACADELEQAILREGPDTVAAFMVEPIIGVGGHIVPAPGYYPRVREICDRYDVLLIADEVVTGFGRTGRFFGLEHWGVVPDIMSLSKGITSGYLPLSACMFQERIYQAMRAGDPNFFFSHGHTSTGHPVCCAAAIATIHTIQDEGLVERSRELGEYLLQSLREGLADNPFVGEIRGLGLLASAELVRDLETRERFPASAGVGKRVYQHALDRGVIIRAAYDTISLRPPLICTREQIDRIVEVVVDAARQVEQIPAGT